MTPEEKSLLERTYYIADENNKMLRSIKRSGQIALAMRVFYWVIIIGVSFGAYYFIEPYIDTLTSVYGAGINSPNSVQSAADSLKDLFQ